MGVFLSFVHFCFLSFSLLSGWCVVYARPPWNIGVPIFASTFQLVALVICIPLSCSLSVDARDLLICCCCWSLVVCFYERIVISFFFLKPSLQLLGLFVWIFRASSISVFFLLTFFYEVLSSSFFFFWRFCAFFCERIVCGGNPRLFVCSFFVLLLFFLSLPWRFRGGLRRIFFLPFLQPCWLPMKDVLLVWILLRCSLSFRANCLFRNCKKNDLQEAPKNVGSRVVLDRIKLPMMMMFLFSPMRIRCHRGRESDEFLRI